MALGEWAIVIGGGFLMLYGLSDKKWFALILGIVLVLLGFFLISG
jgi:hypothetical protein